VLFHVAKLQTGGGALLALDKQTGETVWRQDFKHYGWSSPVAVYNARGDAWILLGDSGGNLRLLDGKTGQILDQLALEGNIEGSPAVFDDLLVIGTRGRRLYGIRIE
ncbi:MAG: PQQ-binding-like beta-propeller repeat protein, partial [Clostridia bacterium]